MRSCPICSYPNKKLIEKEYSYSSPINGGTIPALSLFECISCGFHYLDSQSVDQAWFDWYYVNVYKTDDEPYSDERLSSLARCVSQYAMVKAIDIGGMDGQLQARLRDAGVFCDVIGVAGHIRKAYNVAILSHTLEHIYDLPLMFERVKSALHIGGLLFIEVPIHLNKFRPQDLEALLNSHGFAVVNSLQLPDYREYKVWRIVGQYG